MAKAWWARCARRTPTTPSCTNWPSSTGTCAPALTVPMCRPWSLWLLWRRTPVPPALGCCTPVPRSTTPARRCWAAACGKATPLCSAAGLRSCWMMGWCERMGLLKAMFQRTDGLPTCTHAHEVGDMFRPFRTDGEWALLIHGDFVGLHDVLVKTDALLNLLAKLCGLHGIRQHSAAVIPCPLCLRITQHGTHRFVELRNDGFRRF